MKASGPKLPFAETELAESSALGDVVACSPWLAAMFLTFEASNVIGLRLMKMAAGGSEAIAEANLMVSEKIAAALEMADVLTAGGTPAMVIERYRGHVGANASRLSAPASQPL
jgi:hypothetical protein